MSASIPDAQNAARARTSMIHDIPPETLIQICFINTYRNWTPFSVNPYDTSTEFSLPPAISDTIRASHVCRRWIDILISAPELWTNMVDPYDMEWMQVILERSRPFGIRLVPPRGERYHYRTEDDFKTETRSQEILKRLVEYHFTHDPNGRSLSLVGDIVHIKFPRLQFLHLELSPLHPLPREFPGREMTPVLKHLHLRRSFIDSVKRLDSLATLTHLTVVDLDTNRKIPPYYMVAVINRLPKLQSTLREALAPMPPPDPVTPKPIHVLDISLVDGTDHISFFLQCAEFSPPLDRVSLHCYNPDRDSRVLDRVVAKVANIFNTFCSSGPFERSLHFH